MTKTIELLGMCGGVDDAMENFYNSQAEKNRINTAIDMGRYGQDLVDKSYANSAKSNPDAPLYIVCGLLFCGMCFMMMKKM